MGRPGGRGEAQANLCWIGAPRAIVVGGPSRGGRSPRATPGAEFREGSAASHRLNRPRRLMNCIGAFSGRQEDGPGARAARQPPDTASRHRHSRPGSPGADRALARHQGQRRLAPADTTADDHLRCEQRHLEVRRAEDLALHHEDATVPERRLPIVTLGDLPPASVTTGSWLSVRVPWHPPHG